jgi:hypothetical protein
MTDNSMEARARRLGHKLGLRATKSRWRKDSIDNHGGFRLLDGYTNNIVVGERFDLTADQVIAYCAGKSLLDTILIDGKPIGDCTAGECRAWLRREGKSQ